MREELARISIDPRISQYLQVYDYSVTHNLHQTWWHQVPYSRVMFPKPISPTKE